MNLAFRAEHPSVDNISIFHIPVGDSVSVLAGTNSEYAHVQKWLDQALDSCQSAASVETIAAM